MDTTWKPDRHTVLGAIITGLSAFGIWTVLRAVSVLAGGGDPSRDGLMRYPAWMLLHYAGAIVFIAILPLQLLAPLRHAYPRVHRTLGRVAAGGGTLAALAGIVVPFVMPSRPVAERTFMVIVGCALTAFITQGVRAARRRDFEAHRRWMLRVTALGLAPLTERIVFPAFAALGIDSIERFFDLFVTALWVSACANVVVAEWWIHHRERGRSGIRPAVSQLAS